MGIFLGHATGCKRLVIYAAEPPTEIDVLRWAFNVTFIDPNTDNEPRIGAKTLDDAVVVGEIGRDGLSERLAKLARKARVSVIASQYGSDPAATAERRLSDSLAGAGLRAAFAGSIRVADGRESKAVAIVDNPSNTRGMTGWPVPNSPSSFSVTAIVAVFNEIDIIIPSLEKLLAQGIDIYLMDNWSTDGTYEAAAESIGPRLVGLERFPAEGPTDKFDFRSLLARKEEIAKNLRSDWFIHCDADEVRCGPWPGVTLKDAIYRVDQEGYNAIDHTIVEFHPTDEGFKHGSDFEEYFRYFSFGAHQADFIRINAWKNIKQPISLAATGGHQVLFEGRRVYPYKFLAKHYPIRSQAHGARKVFSERRARYLPSAKAKGWHQHYDHIQETHCFLADPSALTRFDSERFHNDYFAQRLTGIGTLIGKAVGDKNVARAPRTTMVGLCPLCGFRRSDKLFTIPDRHHKTPGEFTYRRCDSCRTVFQDPMVVAEDLSLCYPKQYYTHNNQPGAMITDRQAYDSASPRSEPRGLRKIRNSLRDAIKSEIQGRPAAGIWGSLGKILSSIPQLRTRAFSNLVRDELLPTLPRPAKALDVGCGAGNRMIALREVGWEVEGVDVDPVAVEVARRASGRPVWLGDFQALELPQNEYGLVFMNHSFEHFADPIAALRRVKSLLAPNGKAVIVYPNPDALGARIFGSAWYPWEVPRHLVLPAPSALLKAAKEMGFEPVHLKFSSADAAGYFAYSRAYKFGVDINTLPPAVNRWDRMLSMIETLLLLLRFRVGEEVRITLRK